MTPAPGGHSAAAVPPTDGARIRVEGVSYRYETRDGFVDALDSIDLEVAAGELVCCVGPSGCGKSTLLGLIAGFLEPTAGRITLDGEPITGPQADRGVVFQQPNLYPWMSVADNVTFGPRMRGVGRDERREQAARWLGLVKLGDFAKRAPYELSGGMQQRVAIARVLANDPRFLLMDEPFGALDALTREHLQEELLAIWRQTRKGIFFITHSAEEAVYLATRVVVMGPRPGHVLLQREVNFSRTAAASPREVRSDRHFIDVREEVMERIYAAHTV